MRPTTLASRASCRRSCRRGHDHEKNVHTLLGAGCGDTRAGRGDGRPRRLRRRRRRAARGHEDRRARLRLPESRDGQHRGHGSGHRARAGEAHQGQPRRAAGDRRERHHARRDAGQRHARCHAGHVHHHRGAQEELQLLAPVLHRSHRRAGEEVVGHNRSGGSRRKDRGRGAVGHDARQADRRRRRDRHPHELRRVLDVSRDQDRAGHRPRGRVLGGPLHPERLRGRLHHAAGRAVRAPGVRRGHEEIEHRAGRPG